MNSAITEYRISKRVEEQFSAFMSGFNELIPQELINVFDERELELLIGGMADIDVEDWKKHTDYVRRRSFSTFCQGKLTVFELKKKAWIQPIR